MKKILSIVLSMTLAMTVFAGCSKPASIPTPEGTDPAAPDIVEPAPGNENSVEDASPLSVPDAPDADADTTIVMGLDDSFPPMGFRDENNQIVGFDIDLATEVCARNNWTLELKPIDWATKEMELSSGRIDCIWNGLTITESRVAEMQMSRPYLANSQVLVVKKDSGLTKKSDLAGKTAGIQTQSSAEEALEKDELKTQLGSVKQYADNVSALQDLKIGRIDLIVLDEVVARYYTSKEPDVYLILEESLAKEEYGIAFKKGNTELCDQVIKTFDEMIADGKMAEISTKWFGKDVVLK